MSKEKENVFTTLKQHGYKFKIRSAKKPIKMNQNTSELEQGDYAPPIYGFMRFMEPYDPKIEVKKDPKLADNGITAEEITKKLLTLAGVAKGSSQSVWHYEDRPIPQEQKNLESLVKEQASIIQSQNEELEKLRRMPKK